jgi:predicted ester cyclase
MLGSGDQDTVRTSLTLRRAPPRANLSSMSADQNKARVLDLIERVMNGHDGEALEEFTSNPAVLGSGRSVLRAFPDVQAQVQWIVADGDMVVVFYSIRGKQQGPWLFVQQPTGRLVETSFMLAFRFDDDGQIIDQWLGSNFVEMFAQLGWGFAPIGETVSPPG